MPRPRFGKKNNFRPRFQHKSKPTTSNSNNEYQHQNQLKEEDVGITQFISTLDGFSGVIKARFSDFQVNEIDVNGEVAKLTNQEIPKDFRGKQEASGEPPLESPLPQIPQNIWDDLKKVLSPDEGVTVELEVTDLSKEQKKQIHECLKTHFSRKINAKTVGNSDKKSMVFMKFDPKDGRAMEWPKDKGEYVHFLVYKECLDTLDVTLKISHCLKIQASNLAYAGVKDKRAKTTQWFSVRRVEPWKLIIKTKNVRNIRIGNITFKDGPLKLGDLKGNKFRIALRNVTGSDELVEKSVESLKDNGFINYFGLQRFGNDKEVPTFAIGVQLLLGNWKEACDIILKVTGSDRAEYDITKAKKVYAETKDAKKALEEFDDNRNTCVEYLLLEGLSKGHENDFVNALPCIPRNTRLLYLHAFQSLVWNTVASKRVEKFGLKVVEGDLVFCETEEIETPCEDDEEKKSQSKRPKVKALTSDECPNYTIYDLVLPLPGYDVTYPKHLEEFYKETLETHGLTLEMTQQKVKEYSLSGTYRRLFGKVQNVSWKIMHYNDPNYNLIRSDLEELKGFDEPKDVSGGAYKALVLEFCLDSASYATMVLREILKTDTSSSAHARLNNYHTKEQKKIRTEEIPENENEDCAEQISLLNDAQKYAAFKSLVFAEDEEENTLKRKHDDEEESENVKVARIDENGS